MPTTKIKRNGFIRNSQREILYELPKAEQIKRLKKRLAEIKVQLKKWENKLGFTPEEVVDIEPMEFANWEEIDEYAGLCNNKTSIEYRLSYLTKG